MSGSRRGERHREEREGLTGEHRLTDVGQLVLAVLFAGVWIADSFFLRWTTFLNAHVALAVRIPLGAAFLAVAALLGQASHKTVFGGARREPRVVREGVFTLVRHPMYLSEILLYLGFLAISPSLAAASVWLATIGFLHYVARAEERLLRARFGEEYAAYMRDVPMWIPRLRR